MSEIPAADVEPLLDGWPVARLATRRSDGAAHLVPTVFGRSGGSLWLPVDGKPKRSADLARLRNLARDPRATLLLDHYGPDWAALWWLRLEGRGRVVRSDEPGFASAADALRAKYPQYREVRLFAGTPILVRFEIERVVSWRASPPAQTPAGVASRDEPGSR